MGFCGTCWGIWLFAWFWCLIMTVSSDKTRYRVITVITISWQFAHVLFSSSSIHFMCRFKFLPLILMFVFIKKTKAYSCLCGWKRNVFDFDGNIVTICVVCQSWPWSDNLLCGEMSLRSGGTMSGNRDTERNVITHSAAEHLHGISSGALDRNIIEQLFCFFKKDHYSICKAKKLKHIYFSVWRIFFLLTFFTMVQAGVNLTRTSHVRDKTGFIQLQLSNNTQRVCPE